MLKVFNVFHLSVENPTMYYCSIVRQLFKFIPRYRFEKTVEKGFRRPLLQEFFRMAAVAKSTIADAMNRRSPEIFKALFEKILDRNHTRETRELHGGTKWSCFIWERNDNASLSGGAFSMKRGSRRMKRFAASRKA